MLRSDEKDDGRANAVSAYVFPALQAPDANVWSKAIEQAKDGSVHAFVKEPAES